MATALGTDRPTDTRPEKPQVIVDLGRRAHGGAAGPGRVLLLDRHRRGYTAHRLHRRPRHPLEELFGVGRERLDVAALRLGEDRVEDQRRLPGPGRPGDHGERPVRDVDVDALQVVLSGAADADRVFHDKRNNKVVGARPRQRRLVS